MGSLLATYVQRYMSAGGHFSMSANSETLPALSMCRELVNAELSPISLSVYSQDIIDDLSKFKERAPPLTC